MASSSRVVQRLGISKETFLAAASCLTPVRLLHVGSSSGHYISDGQHAENSHVHDKERDEF